jgi:hypothetical protein
VSTHGSGVTTRAVMLPAAMAVIATVPGFMPSAAACISQKVLIVQASNDTGSGFYAVTFDEGEWDPNAQAFVWTLPVAIDICDETTGARVARLLDAEVFVRGAELCEVDVNICVLAGDSETTFVVGSPLLSLPTIPAEDAQGRATAAFTVTDTTCDYALLMGLGTPGTGAFRSYYNGYLSEGTRFAHLVGVVYVDNGGTASASQIDPSFGFRLLNEDLHDLSTEIAFTLTANDRACATTTSSMPEPDVCVGDINGDGDRDITDVALLLSAYGTAAGDSGYCEAADIDCNGVIDLVDLGALLVVYGESC